MDTVKFLLGATAALLLGAIVLSWRGMREGVSKAPSEEIAKLQAQIDELRKQVEAQHGKTGTVVAPPIDPNDPAYLKQQLEEANNKLKQQNDAAQNAKLQRDEEGLIAQKLLENKDGELKRARIIAQALLIGRVKEFKTDAQYGDFITMEILMPEQVQVGSILGIRRKTGILAQFKVSDIYPDGAIANPITPIGTLKPEPGDELIFPPLF